MNKKPMQLSFYQKRALADAAAKTLKNYGKTLEAFAKPRPVNKKSK